MDIWVGVQELAKKYGAFLIIDETHTISVGPGGMTGALGLKPDFLTIGKALAAEFLLEHLEFRMRLLIRLRKWLSYPSLI